MELVYNFIDVITNSLKSTGVLTGFFLILIESFIPILPLGVFITLNINAYGLLIGIVISWFATCLGCYISYSLFKSFAKNVLKHYKKSYKLEKVVNGMRKMSFPNLVVVIALPFTPAFLINIACGISEMKKKKFIAAILIGKISTVLFWGCVGKSLLESITDIKTIMVISVFILIAYIASKIVSKKLKIE